MTKYRRLMTAVRHLDDYRRCESRSVFRAFDNSRHRADHAGANAKMLAEYRLLNACVAAEKIDPEDAAFSVGLCSESPSRLPS
jgi:hypothetical protein